MDISQFRLIVSDLDGTLVPTGSPRVSPAVQQTINSLAGKGVQFTIATGRSWQETKPIARDLNVTAPIILNSGAIVMDPNTENILIMKELRPSLVEKMEALNRRFDADCFRLSAAGVFYCHQVNTASGRRLADKLHCEPFRADYRKKENNSDALIKYLFTGPIELLRKMVTEFTLRIQPVPYMILWPPEPNGESFLEVVNHGVSKGQALKWLVDHLNIRLSQILAFGDGYNDLDMLQLAGVGVAIHGASSELTSRADIVIPGPDDDGIARFLNGEIREAI